MRAVAGNLVKATIAVLCVISLTACTMFEQPRIMTVNQTLDDKLLEIVNTRATNVPLESLTDFEWDHFGFVPEGTSATEISAIFGDPVINDDTYTNSPYLFIFIKDKTVVTAPMIILDRFDASQAKKLYKRGITLGFNDTAPNKELLYFSE